MIGFIKTKTAFLFLFAVSFCVVGCATTPTPYSFAEPGSETAEITFKDGNPGVRFVSFEETKLPAPEDGTHWEPILFPAETPLEITVHAFYEPHQTHATEGYFGAFKNSGTGAIVLFLLFPVVLPITLTIDLISLIVTNALTVSTDVVFTCPPLEADGDYRLAFEKRRRKLVLTDQKRSGKALVYEQALAK